MDYIYANIDTVKGIEGLVPENIRAGVVIKIGPIEVVGTLIPAEPQEQEQEESR